MRLFLPIPLSPDFRRKHLPNHKLGPDLHLFFACLDPFVHLLDKGTQDGIGIGRPSIDTDEEPTGFTGATTELMEQAICQNMISCGLDHPCQPQLRVNPWIVALRSETDAGRCPASYDREPSRGIYASVRTANNLLLTKGIIRLVGKLRLISPRLYTCFCQPQQQRGWSPVAAFEAQELARTLHEFDHYIRTNQSPLPNYGDRYRNGEAISSAVAESSVNQIISKRFVKKQQMRWTRRGAHLLLQVRTTP